MDERSVIKSSSNVRNALSSRVRHADSLVTTANITKGVELATRTRQPNSVTNFLQEHIRLDVTIFHYPEITSTLFSWQDMVLHFPNIFYAFQPPSLM